MKIEDERSALAAWSNIAEPGDKWAGALRQQLGWRDSLQWVLAPFTLPDVAPPAGDATSDVGRAWRRLHRRYQERTSVLKPGADLKQLADLGGRLVIPGDAEWPQALNDLGEAAPPALWVLGANLKQGEVPPVSMVGARAATPYGGQVAAQMAYDLYRQGHTIVSGGAYGIDAAAHRGALDAARPSHPDSAERLAGTLPTVAVVCGGLAKLYPPGNAALFRRMLAEGGAIVAESPPSFRPARWRFLERNRLIAAWSPVTVIVEASARSGALATANRALDLGREVAAVPGPVTSAASAGPHLLITQGAALVDGAPAVSELAGGPATGEHTQQTQDTWLEKALKGVDPVARRTWQALPLLESAPAGSVARAAGIAGDEVGAALIALQLAGLATPESGAGGVRWRRSSIGA